MKAKIRPLFRELLSSWSRLKKV